MDFSTVASQALAFLAPFLAKGGEELASGAAKDLWELIKKPFTSGREKSMVQTLEQNPKDPIQIGMVQGKLTDKIEEDPELYKQLLALLIILLL